MVLKRIAKGCGYVEGCGHHPGTIVLIALVGLGALAGGAFGGLVMLVAFGIPYLAGAHDRGKKKEMED